MWFAHKFPAVSLCLLILAFVVAGCSQGERDSIQHYEVARFEPEMPPPAPAVESRLLGGMIVRGAAAWFFKLNGPLPAVYPLAAPFRQFLKSVDFDSDQRPIWTLPDGWREVPSSSPLRYKTLLAPGPGKGVELTVSELPIPGESDEFLLSNLNRWRGQVGLGALDAAQFPNGVERESCPGGTMIVVDLQGKMASAAGPGRAGMGGAAGTAGSGLPGAARSGAAPRKGRLPFRFAAPEGWEPGGGTSMSVAAYQRIDGDKKATITVTPAGGDVVDNYNRWRGQVQLPEAGREELKAASRLFTIQGRQVVVIDIVNEQGTPPQAILAAIVPTEGQTWFIKLMGDASLAIAEKSNFDQMVNSIQFED
ncbi:MAG: hypothetical protein FJ295_12355 [Planctomycetes bacterium]|nr:hypothetical protein [Planctomycetota bacterium]